MEATIGRDVLGVGGLTRRLKHTGGQQWQRAFSKLNVGGGETGHPGDAPTH